MLVWFVELAQIFEKAVLLIYGFALLVLQLQKRLTLRDLVLHTWVFSLRG